MNSQKVSHRLLVKLAKSIQEGGIKDRSKFINNIIAECLPELKENQQVYEQIEKRLDYLTSTPKNEVPPLVNVIEAICHDCGPEEQPCTHTCPTGAFSCENGVRQINQDLCVECGRCINVCICGAIVERSEFAQMATMLARSEEHPVYAILAPSFVGQFGKEVSPEMFKAALRSLGFTEVFEVALAADITTLFEAEEFCQRMEQGKKFMITSCCCPAFIKFIEKLRPKVANLVSPTVSPMIAMGKMLKQRESNSKVIFIGPCIAKKNEAKRADLQPAVDCVLTYKETKALLEAAEIPLTGAMGRIKIDDASHDGRIYAHTGGVTEAITRAVKRHNPGLSIKPVKGNGLKQCGELLGQIEEGKLDANFMEGMGCPGGCVGGPGTIIPVEEGARNVKAFSQRARVRESSDNIQALQWMDDYYQMADTLSKKLSISQVPGKSPDDPTRSGEYLS